MPELRYILTLVAVLLCSTFRAGASGAATISPSVLDFFDERINGNLTKVTWDHAVNSKAKLAAALNDSSIMMLEADIVLGTLNTSSSDEVIPIMAHPPENESDLSLEEFLNSTRTDGEHGVKLDFKTIEVFNASLTILAQARPNMTIPVWLNADILSGPVNATGVPVDPESFLTSAKKTFPESTLSIGWTTRYGTTYNITKGTYALDQIQRMLTEISNVTQPITYPVRAGLAAQSIDVMESLISSSPKGTTLTIWSSDGDDVDGDKLSKLVLKIGVDKVYIDVPPAVWADLHISSGASSAKIGALTFAAAIAALVVFKLF